MKVQRSLNLIDRPVKSRDDDLLQRSPFVSLVAAALLRDNPEGATVVGISGAWGTGKSSVAEMVVEKVEGHSTTVRFEPWMVSGSENLAREFMTTLGRAAFPSDRPEDKEKRSRYYKYAAKSVGILQEASRVAEWVFPAVKIGTKGLEGVEKILKNASEGLEATAKELSLQEAREEISKDLLEIEKPIVVVIDDLDRLDHEEVRTTLRLLKAVADFPNVRYLVLYDYIQIVDALKETVHSPGAFLEKIVNCPLSLPETTSRQRIDILDTYLSSIYDFDDLPSSSRERVSVVFEEILLPGLPTLRHIKRFTTTVAALLPGVIKDGFRNVDLADFLALEFLRQYTPSVYDALREQDGPQVESRYARYMNKEKWLARNAEKLENATAAITDERMKRLADKAIGHLAWTPGKEEAPYSNSDRRFSSDFWRPVYFGFDEARSPVSESKWQGFLDSLSNSVDQGWLRDWDDRGLRDEWVIAITSRAEEIPWPESKKLLAILLAWGDTRKPETSQFYNPNHSWEYAVRFCFEEILKVTPDELNPVTEATEIIKQSRSLVAAAYCISMDYSRANEGKFPVWSYGYDLKPLAKKLGRQLDALAKNEGIWDLPDVGTATTAYHYLLPKEKKKWFDSIHESEERLIKYLDRHIGQLESFHYGFEPGPLVDAIRDLDPNKLTDKGNVARQQILGSVRLDDEHPGRRRRNNR